jgi:hypothetical protein
LVALGEEITIDPERSSALDGPVDVKPRNPTYAKPPIEATATNTLPNVTVVRLLDFDRDV